MLLFRIKEFIDLKGISVSAFEKSIGAANASFAKPLKVGGNIGSDKLENILRVYPDLNPVWLMTGRGNMLIDPNEEKENCTPSSSPSSPPVILKSSGYEHNSVSSSPQCSSANDIILSLVEQIKAQAEEIGSLRQENCALKHRLSQLV